jgi:type VI secretion system protein ImpG
MSDKLVSLYNTELSELRRLTAEFARLHPARIHMSEDDVPDPHVKRLLEGVALLNARIRQKIDDEFPELTGALLDHLYPHYLAPIPSMAVVEFGCQKDLAAAATLPARTEMEAEAIDNQCCRFSTAQPVTLWPITIEEASLKSRPFTAPGDRRTAGAVSVLQLKLRCRAPDQTFKKLGVDRLRFFLRGAHAESYPLHELICSSCVAVAVADSAADAAPVILGPQALRTVGLERDEALLPTPARAAFAYRLLTEFFVFPNKFTFFEVCGLSARSATLGNSLHLYIYLNRARPELERDITAAFALNCTPVINLFQHRSEPIRLTRTQNEYRVQPAGSRPGAIEVYSLDTVVASSSGSVRPYKPLYALTHSGAAANEKRFWHASRRQSYGSAALLDCYLSLVDLDLDPNLPADSVVSVEMTCTNGNLPQRLPFGNGHPILRLVSPLAAVSSISALTMPTPAVRMAQRDQGTWRLVSHLLLNHLSLTGGEAGADALKEMLRLYDFVDNRETRGLIDAIFSITSVQRTARVPAQRGALCRGLEILLELNDSVRPESGMYLLLSVLEQVFALQATINSFTRFNVAVRGKPGTLYKWPARVGSRQLL